MGEEVGYMGRGERRGLGLWGRTVNRRGRKSYRHRVEDVMYPFAKRKTNEKIPKKIYENKINSSKLCNTGLYNEVRTS